VTIFRGDHARAGWAVFAVLLSGLAVVVELVSHTCAGFFFDPLPDLLSVSAYLFLALTIALNEVLLGRLRTRKDLFPPVLIWAERRRIDLRWLLWGAVIATGAALAVAASYTVMFLPLTPLALMPFGWMGFSFCALSPAVNLTLVLLQLRTLTRRQSDFKMTSPGRALAAAMLGFGAAGLLLVGRPVAVGACIERAAHRPGDREGDLARLRLLRAEPEILNLCYRSSTSAWVASGQALERTGEAPDPAEYRRLYYLVTGRPFESADASRVLGRGRSWGFDQGDPAIEDQGGEMVGRAVKGLSLTGSRIDGVLDPDAETAYCEWTLTFSNGTAAPQEARAEILLPEGGVVDKVSLWINGEERPAAFGPRSVVRAAYEEVAVVQQRDPLLVTAKDTGRVLAQCFPVPANGSMKIRLGMSAPLVWDSGLQRFRWSPPAFQQVNFRLPAALRHPIWMEGHWPEATAALEGRGWSAVAGPAPAAHPLHRTQTARAELAAADILHPPVLLIRRTQAPCAGDRVGVWTRRSAPDDLPTGPVDLVVLLDPTVDMKEALPPQVRNALAGRLSGLPPGSQVRLIDAREWMAGSSDAATEWMPASGARPGASALRRWWGGRRFEGGAEPAAALSRAWDEASGRPGLSAVIWLHGATPPDFAQAEALAQRLSRRVDGPRVIGVQLRPGPDALMDELAGLPGVFALAGRDGVDVLGQAMRLAARRSRNGGQLPMGGREPAISGLYCAADQAPRLAPGRRSTPSERLAAASAALAPWYAGKRTGRELETAQKLAINWRLVTPMSGAVVLETQEQYQRHKLSDAAPSSSIPSVPEPGTLAMLTVAGGLAGVGAWRRRRRIHAQEKQTA